MKKLGFKTPFDHIHDVNEYISAARSFLEEKNQISIPVDEDAAMDIASSFIVEWILLVGQPPVDSKERVTQIIESICDTLHRLGSLLPDDPEEVKKELLRLLRGQVSIQ